MIFCSIIDNKSMSYLKQFFYWDVQTRLLNRPNHNFCLRVIGNIFYAPLHFIYGSSCPLPRVSFFALIYKPIKSVIVGVGGEGGWGVVRTFGRLSAMAGGCQNRRELRKNKTMVVRVSGVGLESRRGIFKESGEKWS